MPQLKRNTTRQKYYLPTTDSLPEDQKAWVELEIGDVLIGDIVDATPNDASNTEVGVRMLANRVTDWNYTEDDGTKTPLDLEHIQLLDIADFTFLVEKLDIEKKLAAVKGLSNDQKKS